MLELRQEPRISVERSGWIIKDDGRKDPCVVRNVSRSGAKITLLGRDNLPAEFTLSVLGARHRSRLVWRTRFNVGVAFAAA
jgi:hypothetical protein